MQDRLLVVRPHVFVSRQSEDEHKRENKAKHDVHIKPVDQALDELWQWLGGPEYEGAIPGAARDEKPRAGIRKVSHHSCR